MNVSQALTLIIWGKVMLATNLAASSSPVTPNTIDKSSSCRLLRKEVLILFEEPRLKILHILINLGSLSKSVS